MTPEPCSVSGTSERDGRAAEAFDAHVDERWAEVSARVMAHAMGLTRRSMPVRAVGTGGRVTVSEQVLISSIRQALEPIRGATPVDIRVSTDEQDRYTGVLICLEIDYGESVIPLADEARGRTHEVLDTVLGPVEPPVTVTTMHVHIDDVLPPADLT